ncbi:MAG: FAD-dependent oxidoreductase [Burkholderiales bacterium]|nr:FAD-dependent oxidoreductase [Burkholderiales bacterium]
MNAAVIGGGYAGIAAAVTLAARGLPVTLYEAARTLGGRARRVDRAEAALDNGLHILIGAYRETLRLMRLVGADPDRLLLRMPFEWRIHGVLSLAAAALPAPLHLLGGLAGARGMSVSERLSAARFLATMRRARFRLDGDMSVASLLRRERQAERIVRFLWGPLCVAALNTAPGEASAQVFLNVLRDCVAAARDASDIMLPRTDLTALFPGPAAEWLRARGATILTGERVVGIGAAGEALSVRSAGSERRFDHVVCAVAPHQVASLLVAPELAGCARLIARFTYQPIHSVYLQYPGDTRLPAPMLGFDSPLAQWAFDRGALAGQGGLIGVVISARGGHEALSHDTLARRVAAALRQALGALPAPLWWQVIAEKRATYACTPGLQRPGNLTPLAGLALAGDYTAGDYPATMEAAVRSGVAAAHALIERRHRDATRRARSV